MAARLVAGWLLAASTALLAADAKPVPAAPVAPAPQKQPAGKAPPPAKPAEPPAHTARARALEVKLKGLPESIHGDAGGLTQLLSANHSVSPGATLPNLLSAQMIHGAVIGQAGQSHAEASLASLELTLGTHRITARYVAGRVDAFCRGGRAVTSARAEIVGLVVDGQPVPPPIRPSHRIWWPDGYLALNEQGGGLPGTASEASLTALRAVLKDRGEVRIGHVEAGVNCAQIRPCQQDFITGSGWITMPTVPGPVFFAVTLSRGANGSLDGHLVFEDSASRVRVAAESITAYGPGRAHPGQRLIQGQAAYNGRSGATFRLELTDAGEGGAGDRLLLVLPGAGYIGSGLLQGGDLRLLPCPNPVSP
jgi:hypothetical protein